MSAVVRRSNTDFNMTRISRDVYLAIPTKTSTGRPTQFFLDRQITPNLKIWPAPENSTDVIRYDALTRMNDADAAQKAESDFDALFIKKDIPDDIPEYSLSNAETLISIMVGNNLVSSNGDAKRMIKQGAVKLDNEKVSDMSLEISPGSEAVLKVGKRKFLRIKA